MKAAPKRLARRGIRWLRFHCSVGRPVMSGNGLCLQQVGRTSAVCWYTFPQRMLGKRDSFRLARGTIAACLALLFSFASLAPLAARSLTACNSSCCRSRAKCCCGKANAKPPVGPALSSKSFCGDCGKVTLGSVRTSGFVQPSSRSLAPPAELLVSERAGESSPAADLSGYALRQRPPPASRLA